MIAIAFSELVTRIAANDTLAYKELFLLYHQRLTNFSYSILSNHESAEEVVSDVFINIWNKRNKLNEIKNLHLYLYISTKNLSINKLEKQNRERTFSLDETIVEFKSIYFDPEQLMITAEMFRMVQNAVLGLPPRCQLIFKLIREDGLSYREVAELLQLSVKTIENQMTIALKRIASAIHFDIKKAVSF